MKRFILCVFLAALAILSLFGLFGCVQATPKAEYAITYQCVQAVDNPTSYLPGESFTLKNPSKTGYIFLGWTGDGYNQPTLNVRLEAQAVGDKTFTAHWQAKTYSLVLDGAGGVLESASLKATFGQKLGFLPTPTRQGYEFLAWVIGDEVVDGDTVWDFDEGLTLTATYVRVYTIKFVLEYNVKGVDVISRLASGEAERLNLVKSATQEHVYTLYGVKEGAVIASLPSYAPITEYADDTNKYVPLSWRYKTAQNTMIKVSQGAIATPSIFTDMQESGEIVLYAACSTYYSGWY